MNKSSSTTSTTAPALIPLEAIRARLFRDAAKAARIRRDYGLSQELYGMDLEHALLSSFGQRERDVTASRPDQKEVFEAAVRALGSNSRTWVAFLRGERAIRKALAGYDPTVAATASRDELLGELRSALSGQTAAKDARAMLDWAFLLTKVEDYGDLLRALRAYFVERAGGIGLQLSTPDVTALVAASVGSPSPTLAHQFPGVALKAPGMGPTLASEFLRNLGWSGFKPDRHVRRLLQHWFGSDHPALQAQAQAMARLIGSNRRDLLEFFFFSALGASRSPPGVPINQVDQLVWLFGAVAERKPRSTSKRGHHADL
jgi:hypothetical protein